VVRRFDRFEREDGQLGRLIQYDLCQLSSTVSEKKYEKEGGPGLAECAALIRKYSSQPALDLRNFLGWIFFNLYTGNNDSHAKNLSIYYTPQVGVRLTPFYDLMCTRLYPGLSQEFAFAIGGEVTPGQVGREQVSAMARQLGMQPLFVLRTAQAMAQRLPHALASAVSDLSPTFTPGAKVLAERLAHKILSMTKQTSARILAPER
jgi:serine/threonine-protein kinase HipA